MTARPARTACPMHSDSFDTRPIPALVGPTGVGKTAVGVALGRRFGAEIVSADSRQIYRYMDIGTAKPTAAEQAAAPHHLIDIVDPDVRFSAGEYGRRAGEAIRELARRDVPALIVGGAGLYIRALAGGLFDAPEIPRELRERLAAGYGEQTTAILHGRLGQIDPTSAARINANDRQRIERALEVYDATGATLTSWFDRPAQSRRLRIRLIGLRRERTALYARIDNRVDRMMASGFEEEVRDLMDRGYGAGTHGLSTFGYAEMLRCIRGELAEDAAVSIIRQRSRQYAKRQLTWFRQTPDVLWISVAEGEGPEDICEKMLEACPRLLL